MKYIDYVQLSPIEKFTYKLSSFFKAIPGALAGFFSAIGKFLKSFVQGIGNFFKDYATYFKTGGPMTKLSYVVMGAGCLAYGQVVKGIIFLLAEILFIVYMATFGGVYISKFGTLGTVGSHVEMSEDGFEITVASEIMAILCLASDITDLKARLGRTIVAYTYDGKPVTAHDLHAEGAMAALLKDALKPNLVQTLEHTPAFIHGGPFANIAHGCNSVTATRMALKLSDYTVTEAGFAADLGAEKFLDIKCRLADLHPSAVVLVATVRALKYHGGVPKADLNNQNLEALEKGLPNLLQHIDNIKNVFGLPCVVAINAFPTDTKEELDLVEAKCRELGVNVALSEVWAKGGEGGKALAQEVVRLCEEPNDFRQSYPLDATIEEKLDMICKKIYHADGVQLVGNAIKQVKQLTDLGFAGLPICMAKTQYSFSDDPALLGAPKGFTVSVRNLKVSAGAGFIVALTGDIMTMPGLPKVPAAERIDVDENGVISGLF